MFDSSTRNLIVIDADVSLGSTDVSGARSSFKRLLKTPRRYRTGIYWSISNRTRPRTCVCARPSFLTTVFSTCTCRRYKKTACVDSLFIRTMANLVKRHIVCIQALNRIKSNKLKRAIIANVDADLLCALTECAYNILKKNIPLTELQSRRLSKYRTKLRELAQRRTSAARRRRILLQQQVGEGQSGGFLSAFLAPLASSVFLQCFERCCSRGRQKERHGTRTQDCLGGTTNVGHASFTPSPQYLR